MRNYYEPGQWNVICDRCGLKRKSGQVRQEWTGLMVCADTCYETRHPQTLIQVPEEHINTEWARPEPADIFIDVPYIDPDFTTVRNLLSYTEVFTNPAWLTSNVTVATATDPNGTLLACTLTATASSSSYFAQTITVASTVEQGVNSVFAKRISGTTDVNFYSPNGLSQTTMPLTSSWTRYTSNPSIPNSGTVFAWQIVFNAVGDSIAIAFPQAEFGTEATAYQKRPGI